VLPPTLALFMTAVSVWFRSTYMVRLFADIVVYPNLTIWVWRRRNVWGLFLYCTFKISPKTCFWKFWYVKDSN
jgi:hypothetical protein